MTPTPQPTPHAPIAYTFLGRDDDAEQDVDKAEELGHDRSLVEADIVAIKDQRQ